MRGGDRELLGLAVPALGALVAEPLFLLGDSAVVGRLGTVELAGLSLASAVLLNVVLLCTFLTYGTTTAVAQRAGAGDTGSALRQGVEGIWLATLIGVGLAGALLALAGPNLDLLGASARAEPHALAYLRVSALGLPAMLIVLASTGALRGLKNTRRPLLVMIVAAVANLPLNILLVHGLGMGVFGCALGTVLLQAGAAAWLAGSVIGAARRQGVPLGPDSAGMLAAASASVPLFARTAMLRLAIVAMTFVAAAQGDTALASHQVAFTLWYLLAMPPEAFAIAGQAMVGHAVGASNTAALRDLSGRALRWGLGSGLAAAVLLLATRSLYIPLFSSDPAVHDLVWSLVFVVAATQPIGAVVYVVDGVLIGAGDTRFLAWSMLSALLVFLPLAGAVLVTGAGVVALWWALTAWLLARQVAVVLRYRSMTWVPVGVRG